MKSTKGIYCVSKRYLLKKTFMIITVISFKGGVGKSTLSQNLAVSYAHDKREVCILDADKNESSSIWERFRDEDLPNVPVYHVSEQGDISKTINNLSDKYDIVIVDCPPAIENITSKAVVKSDVSLIPVSTTGGGDIWATEKFLEHIELLRAKLDTPLPCYFVVNRYESNVNMHKAYLEALKEHQKEYNLGMISTLMAKRNAYGEANANGRGVLEWDNPKAKKETKAIADEVFNITLKLIS